MPVFVLKSFRIFTTHWLSLPAQANNAGHQQETTNLFHRIVILLQEGIDVHMKIWRG